MPKKNPKPAEAETLVRSLRAARSEVYAAAAADIRRNLVIVPSSFAKTFADRYLRGGRSLDALMKRLRMDLHVLPEGFTKTDGWFLDAKHRVVYVDHGTKPAAMRRAALEAAVRFAARFELGGKGLAYIDHKTANAVARTVERRIGLPVAA